MTRVTASFESREALLSAIAAANRSELTVVTALLPAHDADVIEAIAVRSRAGVAATAGGFVGGIAGMWFSVWSVGQWPRVIVGGKPLLSWPTFFIIAFELAILGATLAAIVAFMMGARRGRRAARGFDLSLGGGIFGLLIACDPERVEDVTRAMREQGAVTCRVV